MNKITLKIKTSSCLVKIPKYETPLSAGMDVNAYIPDGEVIIEPGETKLIPTGLFFEIPPSYEIQVRPRSGLAAKNSLTVLNSPGTIDADYRGEVQIILINHGKKKFIVENQMRIAQLILTKIEQPIIQEVNILSDTDRGSGGFGSTGTK